MKLSAVLLLSLSACILLSACKKDDTPAIPGHQMVQYGVYFFSYYDDGKLKTVTYPTGIESYVYNADGVVNARVYSDNTRIVYDGVFNSDKLVSDLIVTRTFPDGTVANYVYEYTYLNKVLQTEKSLSDGITTEYIYTDNLLTERHVLTNNVLTYISKYTYFLDKPNKNTFSYGMPDLASWTELHGKPPAFLIKSAEGFTVNGSTQTPAGKNTYGYSLDLEGYVTQISYTTENGLVISNEVKYQ